MTRPEDLLPAAKAGGEKAAETLISENSGLIWGLYGAIWGEAWNRMICINLAVLGF